MIRLGGICCIAGILCAGLIHVMRRGHGQVVLEPTVAEFVERPTETSPVSALFQLRNDTASAIRVTKASASCGCLELLTQGGRPLSTAIELAPGQSLPWQARIKTAGRIGPQVLRVEIEAESDHGVVVLQSQIKLDVRAGVRADPKMVVVRDIEPGEQVSRFVDICDALPDPGIEIGRLDTTSAPGITVTASQVPLEPGVERLVQFGSADLKRRFKLRLDLKADSTSKLFDARVFFTSRNDPLVQLEIPISVTVRDPKLRASPSTLVFRWPAAGRDTKRRVLCTLRPGIDSEIRLASVPRYMKAVAVRTSETQYQIDVELSELPSAPDDDAIVLGLAEDSSFEFQLPCIFIDA